MSSWLLWPLQLYVLALLDALRVMLWVVQVRTLVLGLLVIVTVGTLTSFVRVTLAVFVQVLIAVTLTLYVPSVATPAVDCDVPRSLLHK